MSVHSIITRSLRILTLSYARKRHRPGYWVNLVGKSERPDFAERSLWNVGKSLDVSLCGFDDRRPAGNFTLHQCGEWLLTSLCLARNVTADIDQALSHVVVVQCLIQRVTKLVQYRSRHALRRKQGKPWQCLEFRQPSLLRCRDIWQSRVTFSRRDCVCLNGPGLNVQSDFNCEAHVVDLAAEQAAVAGATPLNGTMVGFTPSSELSRRPKVNVMEPTPACAIFNFSAFALT